MSQWQEVGSVTSRVSSSVTSLLDLSLWALCGCPRQFGRHRMQRLSIFPDKHFDRKKVSTKSIPLTGQQRLIIMRTWHKLSVDISALAISAMTHLLEKNLGVSKLFQVQGAVIASQPSDPRFRQHAFWLIQAVSAVVENLDDVTLMLSDMFLEIGEKHAAIPNFSSSFFKLLPQTYAHVWEEQLRNRFTTQTDKSWGKVFNFIVDCLMEGCRDYGLVTTPAAEEGTFTVVNPSHSSTSVVNTSTISILKELSSSFSSEDESESDSTRSLTSIYFTSSQHHLSPGDGGGGGGERTGSGRSSGKKGGGGGGGRSHKHGRKLLPVAATASIGGSSVGGASGTGGSATGDVLSADSPTSSARSLVSTEQVNWSPGNSFVLSETGSAAPSQQDSTKSKSCLKKPGLQGASLQQDLKGSNLVPKDDIAGPDHQPSLVSSSVNLSTGTINTVTTTV